MNKIGAGFFGVLSGMFLCVFAIGHLAYAEESAAPIIVANVNIYNAAIVSQNGHDITLSFDLNNGAGIQDGVGYDVSLIQNTATGQVVADKKVYEERLFLSENSNTHREITYAAPASLAGTYMLLLMSHNKEGLPLGVAPVGSVSFEASGSGVTLDASTCALSVLSDSKTFGLLQGVDIKNEETLTLSCEATNTTSESLTLRPVFETRYRTEYGEVVATSGGDMTPVVLKSGEQKVSFSLPKPSTPQAYTVKLSLTDGTHTSNTIAAHYVLRGASATLQNIQLDKDAYKAGENAHVTILWSGAADQFPEARYTDKTPSATQYRLTLSDGSGKRCAESVTGTLAEQLFLSVPVAVTQDCVDPKLEVVLLDADQNQLAAKTLTLTTPKAKSLPTFASEALPSIPRIILIAVSVIMLGVVAVALARRSYKRAN